MVKQVWRTDRYFLPAGGSSVAKVRFPVSSTQRLPPLPQQVSGSGSSDGRLRCSTASAEEKGRTDGRSHAGGHGSDGGSGESEPKRARQERNEESAALTNRDKASASCDPAEGVPVGDQQGAAELSEDSRAAQLQSVGSLKVTIQRSSESREFGPTERSAEHPARGLHCHVCNVTCRSPQVFQEHMSGQEHLRKLQEVTHSICLNTHTLLDRGWRPHTQRWCDTCQIHFSGEVINHRRTEQHKVCKKVGRPFCSVCQRHFRTPRKFVEHMKSADHKEQVQLEEAQEEELITVDAVGCFEEEEEEEEEKEEQELEVEEEEPEEEDTNPSEPIETKERDEEDDRHGSRFVVPVCGFVCRLCNKFFYKEARHTHCRTHTHRLHVQNYRAQRRRRRRGREDEGEDRSAPS